MTAEMILILTHRLFSAVSQGRVEAVGQYLAPTFRFHDPSLPGVRTREECLALLADVLRVSPDLLVTIEDEVVAEGRVAVRYAACGAMSAYRACRTGTSRRASTSGLLIARCEDGRLLDVWHVSHTPDLR